MASTSSIGASNSLYNTNTSSRVGRFVARNDQNGDGQISLGEFQAIGQNLPSTTSTTSGSATTTATATTDASGRATLFSQIDSNGDGELSTSELSAYQQQQVSTAKGALLNLQEVFGGGQSGQGDTGQGGTGEVRHAHHGHRHATGASASADATGATAQADGTDASSGGLSDAENAFFSAVDTNGDGAISKGELSSFLTQAIARYGATATAGTATSAATTTGASA